MAETFGEAVRCPICNGSGSGYAVWGQLDTHYDCLRCNGTGRIPTAKIKPRSASSSSGVSVEKGDE
jgi:DnaJ-class molecular chaperone